MKSVVLHYPLRGCFSESFFDKNEDISFLINFIPQRIIWPRWAKTIIGLAKQCVWNYFGNIVGENLELCECVLCSDLSQSERQPPFIVGKRKSSSFWVYCTCGLSVCPKRKKLVHAVALYKSKSSTTYTTRTSTCTAILHAFAFLLLCKQSQKNTDKCYGMMVSFNKTTAGSRNLEMISGRSQLLGLQYQCTAIAFHCLEF